MNKYYRTVKKKLERDPILALAPVAWWDDDDIPGTLNGDSVTSWTDRVASQTLTTYVAAPTLELVGAERAVKFNDTNCLSVAEFAAINFTGQTDSMTYMVQMGNAVGSFLKQKRVQRQ